MLSMIEIIFYLLFVPLISYLLYISSNKGKVYFRKKRQLEEIYERHEAMRSSREDLLVIIAK